MRLYVFSKEAKNDLVEIYRYGFINYGENKADQYIEALKEKCQFLADIPNLCPDRDAFNPSVKIHHHRKHLIIYVIENDDILIVRVLHDRMDIQQHMEK
ncbi:MAG: type II toxin-antitoxin system RelE/ParE family toxin [Methylococcales symbiont of Iophon sp. n. MRB-2018]|nr:MAG: type II toxin-antitoxin system RelE/ParE family toxin [Methylococcales symbiont of Iophon sp. n. MRB-2018]KAF3980791.1 MAG: type II toxin-antitoxin system RelE/ParE family toxin [Methylococcales symbiont of Iophon sp. n. MRB-2018]